MKKSIKIGEEIEIFTDYGKSKAKIKKIKPLAEGILLTLDVEGYGEPHEFYYPEGRVTNEID